VAHRRSRPHARPREARRDGRRIARLFREVRGLQDVRCCNLEQILEEDEIELGTFEQEHPGCAACLYRTPGWSGIMLPTGQTGGRRRFSIAHELGHFHIPSHVDVSGYCQESDLLASEGGAAIQEWEANDFASELLMPQRLFTADAAQRNVSIRSVIELADSSMYDVSLMAAALRVVQTTPQAAAIVVSANGRVSWSRKSGNFRLWLPGSGDRLHHDTMAAAAYRRVEASEESRPVPIAAWVDRSRRTRGELLESVYRIDSQDQIVSLLWYVDHDGEGDQDDDDSLNGPS
jgi:Zn-dependent peptidase ImmA (M78 family)